MEKLLVIGLGGSGGKTLAFLMDELKFQLGDAFGGDLPDCWEFVHIDVPLKPDAIGKKLAAPVDQQGGTYVGLGATSYQEVDSAVYGKLQGSNPSAEDSLARWRPDKHEGGKILIASGAGAYRGIGRMVTVSRADHIHAQLSQVLQRLSRSEDLGKLESLTGETSTVSSSSVRALVVSSLVGGSGASMVLDVADILRSLNSKAGLNSTHTAAFLFTADVFGPQIAPTAGAGSLATISELVNSLRNTDSWSNKEWAALGASGLPKPQISGRGPFMIFPIGSASHGVPFGEEPEDVYRGFARMLAPVFVDDKLQNSFWSYVQTNALNDANSTPDNSRISETASVGADTKVRWAHFGGFGSATLTMGRKRYLEYASQRIAREAVELLVNGHGVNVNTQGNPDQRKRELAAELKDEFLLSLPLGYQKGTGFTPEALISAASPKTDREGIVNAYLSEIGSVFGNQPAQAIAAKLKAKLTAYEQALSAGSEAVTKSLRTWAEQLQTSVEDAYLNAVSQYGLEVAGLLLEELQSELTTLASQTLGGSPLLTQNPPPAGAISADVVGKLAKRGKEIVGPTAAAAVGVKKDIFGHFNFVITKQAGSSVRESLLDYVSNGLRGLKDSNSQLLTELVYSIQMKSQGTVTAEYREAPLAEWPRSGDDEVPDYFEPAVNEVMLESTKEFPTFFSTHIGQSVSPSSGTAIREAAKQIILQMEPDPNNPGEFRKIGGWSLERENDGSHPHLGRKASWYPSEISSAIGGLSKSAAEYQIAMGHESLLTYARAWVERRDSTFELFARQGFRDWLNPMSGSSPNLALQKERRTLLEGKMITALKYASPLVQVDEQMISRVHGNEALGLKFDFSTIPLGESDPVIAKMQNFWQGSSASVENNGSLEAALDITKDVTDVFISSRFTSPYVPLVFKSLTEPIRNEWTQSVASGSTSSFWQWRRARPLRNFVPMSQQTIDAFIQGWLVGRLSGHIQLQDNAYKTGYQKVRVWSAKGEWLEFDADPELLGVEGMGLKYSRPGQDNSGWNVPAILLEHFALSISKCQGMDLSPLDPYWAVVDMGLTLQKGDPSGNGLWGAVSTGLSPLQEFLTSTCSAQGVPGTQMERLSSNPDSESRRQASIEWLDQVNEYSKGLQSHKFEEDNFYTVNRVFEIAPEIQRACENLLFEMRDLPASASDNSSGGGQEIPDA